MAIFEKEDSHLLEATFFYNFSTESIYPIFAHWHYHIEGLYIISGSVRIFLNGEIFALSTGDFVQFNPRDIHAINKIDTMEFSYCVLRLPVCVFYTDEEDTFTAKYILPYLRSIEPRLQILRAGDPSLQSIALYVAALQNEVSGLQTAQHNAIAGYCTLIYVTMLRHWNKNDANYNVRDILAKHNCNDARIRLEPAFVFLAQNFRFPISAQDIAASCNMSYSHFAKSFKGLLGHSVTQYINHLRVEEAERLLLINSDNVTQIAMKTGFPDASHFIKAFKHIKGITPKQFQKRFL